MFLFWQTSIFKANAATAIEHITNSLNVLEHLSPDSRLILEDFNHCSPDKSLKGFQQYVTCITRNGTLDKWHGRSPHHPAPTNLYTYHKVVKRCKDALNPLTGKPPNSIKRHGDMDEHMDIVSSHIYFHVDVIIPSKTSTIFPNNKPWVIKELKKRMFSLQVQSLRRRKSTGRSSTNIEYKNKVEEKFTQGKFCSAWQGSKPWLLLTSLPPITKLYRWQGAIPWHLQPNSRKLSSLELGYTTLTVETAKVVRAFRRTRENSSPGLGNISCCVMRLCAKQLGAWVQILFQRSTTTSTVPQLWKHSNVITRENGHPWDHWASNKTPFQRLRTISPVGRQDLKGHLACADSVVPAAGHRRGKLPS